jgi:hypothetical protein
VARNACGLALLAALALAGCSNFSIPFLSGNKEEQEAKAAEAKLAVIRARTDSLRKARHLADSLAQVRHIACVDSVRSEMVKMATPKTKSKKKKQKVAAPSEEMILAQAQNVCGQDAAAPQTTVAVAQPAATDSVPPAAPTPSAPASGDLLPGQAAPTAAAPTAAAPTAAAPTAAAPAAAVPIAAAPAHAEPVLASNDSVALEDSVRKAKEIEMSRETFSYGGAARDPFNSLLNMAKNGPELADLQLVGIYQNLRTPSSSVAVFREKAGGKRHKLRAGDQVGRSRLVQIRDRDVVFMIEDFGFERQETLSLRKQEDVLQ